MSDGITREFHKLEQQNVARCLLANSVIVRRCTINKRKQTRQTNKRRLYHHTAWYRRQYWHCRLIDVWYGFGCRLPVSGVAGCLLLVAQQATIDNRLTVTTTASSATTTTNTNKKLSTTAVSSFKSLILSQLKSASRNETTLIWRGIVYILGSVFLFSSFLLIPTKFWYKLRTTDNWYETHLLFFSFSFDDQYQFVFVWPTNLEIYFH